MTAPELIAAVKAAGGSLALADGERIRYELPAQIAPLLKELRTLKPAVMEVLQRRQQAAWQSVIPWANRHCVAQPNVRSNPQVLYREYQQSQPEAVDYDTFVGAVELMGFRCDEDGLVAGLYLVADWDACQDSPARETCRVHGADAEYRERTEGGRVCGRRHPDARLPGSGVLKSPPAMPPGVKLLSWRPALPPVMIARHSVVIDVERFVERTLQQLEAALEGKPWLAGNWTVRDLMERLDQCGLKVEVEAQKSEGGR